LVFLRIWHHAKKKSESLKFDFFPCELSTGRHFEAIFFKFSEKLSEDMLMAQEQKLSNYFFSFLLRIFLVLKRPLFWQAIAQSLFIVSV
jgi:hypothetical protein